MPVRFGWIFADDLRLGAAPEVERVFDFVEPIRGNCESFLRVRDNIGNRHAHRFRCRNKPSCKNLAEEAGAESHHYAVSVAVRMLAKMK